ncbi:hypothetical protein C5E16_14380 [Clavibacter michiganensis]|uniref:Uncharacterized protein n=2 Tax=Clavibacter michiganensis TaxID=28447 RepID=A0A2S5VNV3_9MICO|nr:hypothetical protein C5E16_14380 [Clavibacter michiganensis]
MDYMVRNKLSRMEVTVEALDVSVTEPQETRTSLALLEPPDDFFSSREEPHPDGQAGVFLIIADPDE